MAAKTSAAKTAAAKAGTGPLSSIEAPVMGIISAIPVPQFSAWANAYFNPVSSMGAMKKEASLTGIITTIVLAGLLIWLGSFLSTVIGFGFGFAMALIFGIAVIPIMLVIVGLIGSGLIWALAKILGGTGGYFEQTSAFSILFASAVLLAFPFSVLSGLPALGFIFYLLGLAVGVYNLYNFFLVIREVHKVSDIRALAILAIPILTGAVLAMLVFASIAALLGLGVLAGRNMMY